MNMIASQQIYFLSIFRISYMILVKECVNYKVNLRFFFLLFIITIISSYLRHLFIPHRELIKLLYLGCLEIIANNQETILRIFIISYGWLIAWTSLWVAIVRAVSYSLVFLNSIVIRVLSITWLRPRVWIWVLITKSNNAFFI